jgi:DNA methyltransferase 1-associated protein 1
MADARDILGVDRPAGAPAPAKPEKKERMKRPEGMSREAFALLSGSNPIMTTQLMEGLTKGKKDKLKPTGRGTVVWRAQPFTNQARSDGLQLVHWAKGFKDANGRVRDAHEGDYPFAKFNKTVRPDWGGVLRAPRLPTAWPLPAAEAQRTCSQDPTS